MNTNSTSVSDQPNPESMWRVGSLTYGNGKLATLVFWLLLGGFAWAFKDRCTPSIAQLLLSDFGAPDNFSGVLIGSLPYAMALFVLPVLGYCSDRYRSREGRRIPFLTKSIPIIALSMPGLTLSPWLGSVADRALGTASPGNDACVIIFVAFFWGLFQFADILGLLIIAALINDVVPQAVLGRFFAGYRAIGLAGGVLFNLYLFDGSDTLSVALFGGFGILCVLAICLMCIEVREGEYPPPPEIDPTMRSASHQYVQECFSSSFYCLVFVAYALSTTAYLPVNLYSTLFSRELMTPDFYGKLLALTFTISFVLAYPLGMLADRFHPLRIGMVAMTLYAVVTLWGGLFAQTPTTFNVAFVLHGVMAGSCMTSMASLLQRLLPRMKFAQFASAATVVACIVNIIVGPITGYVLGDTHPVYQHLFLESSAMAWLGLIALVFLYRAYVTQGGDESYTPPRTAISSSGLP